MGTRIDMIGIFVADIAAMVAFTAMRSASRLNGTATDHTPSSSMKARASRCTHDEELPRLLGRSADLSERSQRYVRAGD